MVNFKPAEELRDDVINIMSIAQDKENITVLDRNLWTSLSKERLRHLSSTHPSIILDESP